MKRYFFIGLFFALLAVAVLAQKHTKWTYPVVILDTIMAVYYFNRWRVT